MSCNDCEKVGGYTEALRVCDLLRPGQHIWPVDTYILSTDLLFIRRLDLLISIPQQFLCVFMHPGELLGDGVL